MPAYVAFELLQSISHLIDKCIKTNCFSHQLKLANINLLHKKGCNDDPLNYRPISVFPVMSKVSDKF